MNEPKDKWNARYRGATSIPEVAWVLLENHHLLPPQGKALDLACGLGGNTIWLAKRGLTVWAWDISDTAIAKLAASCANRGLKVCAEVRDLRMHPPEPERFDVIVVSHFLDRSLSSALIAALRPKGLLFYQTFIRDRVDNSGPRNPDFLLEQNELLRLFTPLRVIVYREEGCIGDITIGFRNKAMLVAQRQAGQ